MAAVGALFSTAEGNMAVAKALYNDARRMHLEQILRTERHPSRSSLDSAKTFILLEIYGLCSGDKRSFEFWEAFHYGTLHAYESCTDVEPTPPPNSERSFAMQMALLSEAVTILESYRVLILLRPPLFLRPQTTTEKLADHGQSVTQDLLHALTPALTFDVSCGNVQTLATISSYAWMSGLHGRELSRNPPLWNPDFIELALERWMNARPNVLSNPGPSELAQVLLYHLAHINIHANLSIFQNCAHHFRHSGIDHETGMLKSLRECVKGAEFRVALWHAKSMLQLVKDAMTTPLSRYQELNGRPQLMEAPHLPYCIYFATLILWYGDSNARCPSLAQDERIEDGAQLLFKLKVQVGKVLGGALGELLSEDSRREVNNTA